MVLVGEDNRHHLVLDTFGVGPVPGAGWRPFCFPCRCLQSGRASTVKVPISGVAEVLELKERVYEFVCEQDGELVFLDPESREVATLPTGQSNVTFGELAPNSSV